MNEYKIVRVRLGCAFVCVLEREREKEEQKGDIEWLSWGDEDRFWKVEWNESFNSSGADTDWNIKGVRDYSTRDLTRQRIETKQIR